MAEELTTRVFPGRTVASVGEPFVIFIILAAVYSWFSRLGVDPHHDGMVLQPAFVVAEGGVPHRDVFGQYGPMAPWAQGLFVFVFGRSLLVVKMATAVLLAGGVALLFVSWRSWKGRSVAYVATALVFLLSYFFTPTLDMRAWSSDILVFFQSISLLAVVSGARSKSRVPWFVAGTVTTLCLFTRLLPGLVQSVMLLVVVLTVVRRGVMPYLTGLVGCFMAVIGFLAVNHGFGEWWYQTVEFPFRWSTGSAASDPLGFLRFVLVDRLLPVFLGPISAAVLLGGWWTRLARLKWLAGGVLGATVTWWLTSLRHLHLDFLGRQDAVWTLVGLTMVSFAISAVSFRRGKSGSHVDLLMSVAAVSAASQIYPVVEARHLWWSIVPVAGTAVAAAGEILARPMTRKVVASVVLVPLAFATVFDVTDVLREPRTLVRTPGPLEGMYFNSQFYRYFDDNIRTVAAYEKAHPGTPIINMCADGLWASLTQSVRMPDSYYVLWDFKAGKIDFDQRARWALKERPIAWFCPPSPDESAQAGLFGLRVVNVPLGTRQLPHQNEWPYKSAVAVPREWPVAAGANG